jgi:hypothetical protein
MIPAAMTAAIEILWLAVAAQVAWRWVRKVTT